MAWVVEFLQNINPVFVLMEIIGKRYPDGGGLRPALLGSLRVRLPGCRRPSPVLERSLALAQRKKAAKHRKCLSSYEQFLDLAVLLYYREPDESGQCLTFTAVSPMSRTSHGSWLKLFGRYVQF